MKSGIYKILNKINNKLYVGSAVNINNRWYLHKSRLKNKKHDNQYLQNAWDKYGESNFLFEVIEFCEREVLIEREQKYIDLYKSWDRKSGYNIAKIAGNTTGCFHTEETKKLIKENNKSSTKEVKEKLKQYWSISKNRKYQSKKRKDFLSKKENRQHLSKTMTEYYRKNPQKKLFGKDNPAYGKKYRNKPVERIDPSTGEIKEYESIRDTAKDGYESTTVGKVCRGKLKTHKGYFWKFKEDKNGT